MLTPSEALDAIAAHAPRLPVVSVALRDASGCVLQQSVRTERDQPPFDRVAMDGIAITSASSSREFKILGTQAAGTAPLNLTDASACFEVMTGAMLPLGCDCVIPVERITARDGIARLADDVFATPWLNLHRRAADCRAGEEVLAPGTVVHAPEAAVLAANGIQHVRVTRAPRIVVISTGDELVEPGAPLNDWQIRRSNVYGVLASLRANGYQRLADDHIVDDERLLRERLRAHLTEADVLILSGGVSMGKFDFVPKVLAELGVQQIFHKISQRPGKPMWFGVHEQTAVYALPGNPVSTLACLARYVLPGLRHAAGVRPDTVLVKLSTDCEVLPALATLLPVQLRFDSAGGLRAVPQPTRGSGDFTSLVGAEGCVELPAGDTAIKADATVKFYRW